MGMQEQVQSLLAAAAEFERGLGRYFHYPTGMGLWELGAFARVAFTTALVVCAAHLDLRTRIEEAFSEETASAQAMRRCQRRFLEYSPLMVENVRSLEPACSSVTRWTGMFLEARPVVWLISMPSPRTRFWLQSL